MLDDKEIAKSVQMKPIEEITEKLGIKSLDLEKYGKYKAKLSPDHFIKENGKRGKLIMVTAMSPTPACALPRVPSTLLVPSGKMSNGSPSSKVCNARLIALLSGTPS